MGISLDEVLLDNNSAIKIQDSAGDELAIAADGSISVTLGAVTDLDIRDLVFATDKVDVSGSSVTATATDFDIRNLIFATDKVDVSASVIALDAATLAALESVTVSATDLDIRNLSAAQDNVAISDGTDVLAIEADGSINVNFAGVADDAIDSGNPVKIGYRAVSGALTAVSASGDRADGVSDLYRRVYVNDAKNIAIKNSAESVSVVAEVLAVPLAGRRSVTIQNEGNLDVYVGSTAGVTAANGIKLTKSNSATFEWGEDIDIFMISSGAAQDIRFLESA